MLSDGCIAPMGVTTALVFDPVVRLMQLLCAPQIYHYSHWYVHMSDYSPTFERFSPSKSFFNFTACFVKMCMHACPLNSFSSDYWWLEPMCSSRDTCLRSKSEIADNWRLGRVRIAAAENQAWPDSAASLTFIGLCRPWIGSFVRWSGGGVLRIHSSHSSNLKAR